MPTGRPGQRHAQLPYKVYLQIFYSRLYLLFPSISRVVACAGDILEISRSIDRSVSGSTRGHLSLANMSISAVSRLTAITTYKPDLLLLTSSDTRTQRSKLAGMTAVVNPHTGRRYSNRYLELLDVRKGDSLKGRSWKQNKT